MAKTRSKWWSAVMFYVVANGLFVASYAFANLTSVLMFPLWFGLVLMVVALYPACMYAFICHDVVQEESWPRRIMTAILAAALLAGGTFLIGLIIFHGFNRAPSITAGCMVATAIGFTGGLFIRRETPFTEAVSDKMQHQFEREVAGLKLEEHRPIGPDLERIR